MMVIRRLLLLIVTITSHSIFSDAVAACFNPDGTVNTGHSTCNFTISDSACCDPLDSCTTSGMCLGRTGFNYRGSCTDRTWGSTNCGQLCYADPVTNKPYSSFTSIFSCAGGVFLDSYCCESIGKNCCEIATFKYGTSGFAFKGGMDLLLQEIANKSSLSSQIPYTVTVTATANLLAQTNSNGSPSASVSKAASTRSSNLGPAIGLGVGLPLGLLVIGITAFLFWRERKNSRIEAEARLKVMELDSSLIDQRSYYSPGVPPEPPRKSPSVQQSTWVPSIPELLDPRVPPAGKSPGFSGPTGMHELI